MLSSGVSSARDTGCPGIDMLAVQPSNALNELPLRAQVAFASRCARRVINLFRLQSNHPDLALCCKSLGMAIRLAESFAAGDDVDADDLATAEKGPCGPSPLPVRCSRLTKGPPMPRIPSTRHCAPPRRRVKSRTANRPTQRSNG